MNNKKIFSLIAVFFLVATIFETSIALAQTLGTYSSKSSVSVTYQTTPSFQTYYGSNVNTYWPILGDEQTCEARQDMQLQIAPLGCQPAVVRSDLLAEQNVPVFCQIDAITLNPLIQINQIKNIQFSGQYPEEVAGSGFHPARAALRTQDTLLGSPLANNIGYAVVVLKQQPDESKLPDFVNVTLQAYIEYSSENAYGIGRTDFLLEQTTDQKWESEKLKQSFWNGRYFLRLEEVDENSAVVSIYEGDRKVATTRVDKGETSQKIYVPGMYCRAALQVSYTDLVAADKKARIEVSSPTGTDAFDVYEGSTFLDGRCSIRRIDVSELGETGRVIGSCQGKEFVLELKTKTSETSLNSISLNGQSYNITQHGAEYWADLKKNPTKEIQGNYFINSHNELIKEPNILIYNSTSSTFGSSVKEENKQFFTSLYQTLTTFIKEKTGTVETTSSLEYFDLAIENYESVADKYANEGEGIYAQEALEKAIDLAKQFGKDQTRISLINKYLALYPNGRSAQAYLTDLNSIEKIDASLSGEAIQFDEGSKVIRLVNLKLPTKSASAEIAIENKIVKLNKNEKYDLMDNSRKIGEIKLEDIQVESAKVGAYCVGKDNILSTSKQNFNLRLNQDATEICGQKIKLDTTNIEKSAKIKLTPTAEGTRTATNLTVNIGIEKRAIQLTPDKVEEKIENLNKTIAKWEKITDSLGNIISGLKTACFATAGLLTFKNFFTGLNGETLARQKVMSGDNGWTQRCKALVPSQYPTLDACFLAKASDIDAEVAKTTAAINTVNTRIQQIQSNHITNNGLFEQSADAAAVRKDLAADIKAKYGPQEIDLGNTPWINAKGETVSKITVNDLLTDENINNGIISTEELRSIALDAELRSQSGLTTDHLKSVNSDLQSLASRTNSEMLTNWEYQKSKELEKQGYPQASIVNSPNTQERVMSISPATEKIRTDNEFSQEVTNIAVITAPATTSQDKEKPTSYASANYVLGLKGDAKTGTYTITEVRKQGDPTASINVADFSNTYQIGTIKAADRVSYLNKIQDSDNLCRYYETEPYRGMPAVVPFDTQEGWYAATRQTLPALGGIGAFDASGRVTSFWVCNVGSNGRIEFNTGYGDDLCQQINTNTGQPQNLFPGLDSAKATALIQKAQRAIQDASQQYGNSIVTVAGERCQVGAPEIGVPGTQCQDFMSPRDCNLLFNVCDPVICPASRCDFGGTYRVADVVQSGIIGSIFLCLPNIREGIAIPVCLTGINAGIEGLVSIMKNYRDCLQENLDTGQMVGICDEIYSVYLCEFFWNQVAPLVNVLLPKVIELAYGQGVRGGAEYLSVMSAWQNMENSINYFTQQYAVNSIQAFQARSVNEVGTQFCKAFISAKAPTAFKSLVQADSPPQFHAWFDEKTFTTATVPATSQYKVFYHIYSGNDQGVTYNVYLKNPPQSGYYASQATIPVASGYINKGDYASETKDFTAPQGYKELCVRINNDEQCGFGQVSTSFAVNYLRDQYIKDEATQTITSEKTCVSGTNNPATLLNPNIQAGVEETISPSIYNRGIIRICASQNPGSTTDPTRFTDVGYCDDPKIRCWIDKRSVEQSITTGNVGTLNSTLEELEARDREILQQTGQLYDDTEAAAKLQEIRSAIALLKESTDENIQSALNIVSQTKDIEQFLFWNHQKAQLLIFRGDAYAFLARANKAKDDEAKRQTRGIINIDDLPSSTTTSSATTSGETCEIKKITKTENYIIIENSDKGLTISPDSKITATDKNGATQTILEPNADGSFSVPQTANDQFENDVLQAAREIESQKATLNDITEGKVTVKACTTAQTTSPEEKYSYKLGKNPAVNGQGEIIFRQDNNLLDNSKLTSIRLYQNNLYVKDITTNQEIVIGFYSIDDQAITIDAPSTLKEKISALDFEVLTAIYNKYSYCDMQGKECTTTQTAATSTETTTQNTQVTPEATCSAVCEGLLKGCYKADCAKAGNCFYVPYTWDSQCHSCPTDISCAFYTTKESCDQDMCEKKNCNWDPAKEICVKTDSSIIENYLKQPGATQPCFDGEGRLKINLPNGLYGINSNNVLETYLDSSKEWVVYYGSISNFLGKTRLEWVIQLENELKKIKAAGAAKACTDQTQTTTDILPENDRFVLSKDANGIYHIYYHLKAKDELKDTDLFIPQNTKIIASQSLTNPAVRLKDNISPDLQDKQSIEVEFVYPNYQSTSFGEGENKISLLDFKAIQKDRATFKVIIQKPSQATATGEPFN